MIAAPVSTADLLAHHARELAAAQERVDTEISPRDAMFVGHREAYFLVGRSALTVVTAALIAAGKHEVGTILDLPCGHGRVLRMLRARFPSARIVGCELDPDGADYCAARFGSEPVYSTPDPAQIPIREQFDLIWVGSLLTHVDAPQWYGFLDFFTDRLAPEGVLVFTFGGRYDVQRPDGVALARPGYHRHGFGYHEPPESPGYGTAYATPEWVLRFLAPYPQRLIGFWERGWNDHQDVVALLNRPVLADWELPRLV